jgi:hypothetical protein
MNDFLHSLRNGMDKRNDKNRRNYNGNQFNPADRRRPKDPRYGNSRQTPNHGNNNQLTQLLTEMLPEIKKSLDSVAESQDRLIDARVRRAEAEARKAEALEQIAGMLAKLIDVNKGEPRITATVQPLLTSAMLSRDARLAPAPGRDREAVIATIRTLRENGLSFSAIAARLEENGIPTFSGKGQWRGQTVHKLFKQRAE